MKGTSFLRLSTYHSIPEYLSQTVKEYINLQVHIRKIWF